jgi:hypothetical protein
MAAELSAAVFGGSTDTPSRTRLRAFWSYS